MNTYRADEIYAEGVEFLFYAESGIIMTRHASHGIPLRLDLVSDFDGEIRADIDEKAVVGVFSAKNKLYLICKPRRIFLLTKTRDGGTP